MKHFRSIDIFGKKFNFTLMRDERYKTYIGSFFTFVLLIIGIVFSFLFGSSFFFKTNPSITYQNVVNDQYFRANLSSRNFLIPWMIQDVNAEYINSSGIIYPKVAYQAYELDKNNILQLVKNIKINSSFCPKYMESLIPGISKYYCMDIDPLNLTIGGDWSGPYVESIQIGLFYCPNYGTYTIDGNCTSLNDLNNFFQKQVYFSIFYPKIHFKGTDLNNPLVTEYINYYFQLNLGLSKTDRFYFEKTIVQDDQGWIVEDTKTLTNYSMFQQQSDFSLFPVNQYTSSFSRFYKCIYYLNKNYDQYNRSFMKFQNLTALIGGFINLIYICCSLLVSFFSTRQRNISLLNEIFVFSEKEINEKQKFLSVNKLSKINFDYFDKTLNKDQTSVNFKSNIENLSLNKFKSESISHEYKFNENLIIKIDKDIEKLMLNINTKREKFSPGILMIFRNFFECSKHENDSKINSIYNLANEYLKSKLDIISYLHNIDINERLKFILFNKIQNSSFDYVKKINLYDINEFETLKNKITLNKNNNNFQLKELVVYFIEKLVKNQMSETDIRILEGLDLDLQKLIIENTK